MKKQVGDETRMAILDAAWTLMDEEGRLDVSQAEIAARAGVSRQSVYLAFGAKTGLLLAMVRNKDRRTPHVGRLREIANGQGDRVEDLVAFLDVWLDYLPAIYSVGIQLDAASLTESDAAAAWDSRMKAGLLTGFRLVFERLGRSGRLAEGWSPAEAADFAWSLTHPTAWRRLVAERGWTPDAFRRRQVETIRTLLVKSA